MAVVVSQLVGQISIQGVDQAQKGLTSVGAAATQTNEKLSSIKPFNASNAVTDVDVAQAKLTLLESQVTTAREKLETLQNAADAGKSVTGIPEAEANLVLLQSKAQAARASLTELQSGGAQAAEGLQQVQSEAQEADSGLNGFLEMLQKTASEAAGGFSEAVKSAASNVGGGFFSGIKSAIGGVLDLGSKIGGTIYGIQNFGQIVQQAGQILLGGNADLEQTQVAFSGLLGGTKAANAELQQLQRIAADTPFEFPDLAKSEQQLIAFQIPLKETHPLLLAIGDALSGLGENTPASLQQVVSVFGQMNAAGKLQTQDLMQLTSVGINGFQILADQMGVSTAQIKQMVTDGTIPASKGIEMLRAGMEATFGGGMQAQSKTFNGLLSTFKDNIGQAWRSFTGPIFDQAKSSLVTMGNLVSSKSFQDFATGAGQDVQKAFSAIGNAAAYVSNVLKTIDLTDFTSAWHEVGTEVGFLTNKLGGLIGNLTKTQGDFDPVAEAIQTIAKSGLGTVTNLLWGFSEAFVNVDKAVQDGTGPLASVISTLKEVGQTILNLDPGIDIIETLGSQSKQLGDWFQSSVVPAFRQAEPGFKNFGQAAQGLLPTILQLSTIFKNSFQGAILALLPVFEKAIPLIIQISGILANGLGSAIKFLQPYIIQAASALGQFADEIATRVAPILSNWLSEAQRDLNAFLKVWNVVWPVLAPILKGVWDAIVGVVQIAWNLLSGIIKIGLDVLGGNWKQAWTDLQDMLKGVWAGIQTFMHGQLEVLQGIWTPLAGFFADAWHRVQIVFGNVGQWFQDRFTDAKNGVVSAFGSIGGWFTDRWHDIQGIFGQVGQWFSGQFTSAKTGATNAFSPIPQFFQKLWNDITGIFGKIGSWFSTQWNAAIAPIQPLITFAQQAFTEILEIILAIVGRLIGDLESKWNQIVAVARTYWLMLQTTIELYLAQIQQRIQVILTQVVGWIEARWNDVKSGVSAAWSWVSTTIGGWWTTIYNTIATKLNQIISNLTGWYNLIKNGISSTWQSVSGTIGSWWNTISSTITGKLNQISGYLNQQWTIIKTSVGLAWSSITSTIGGWWNNIVNTATNKVNTLKTNVFNTFTAMKNGIGGIIKGFIDAIIGQLNNGITGVQNFLNNIGNGLNGIAAALNVKPIITTVHLATIPMYATGTPSGGHPGGPALFGEQGAELAMLGGKKPTLLGVNGPGIADLPRGTSILPADTT